MPNTSVQIVLRDASPPTVSSPDPPSLPRRVISLNATNNWSVEVGRATTSHLGPNQAVNNARFGSKVMSREHARFSADPVARRLYITDIGSMHGTHMHGKRLEAHVEHRLAEDDTITFGAVVDRGEVKYSPVEVKVSSNWLQVPIASTPAPIQLGASTTMPRNDEYLHRDFYSDESDSEIDDETGLVDPPRRFTVPESDLSEDIYSDYDSEEEEVNDGIVDDSPSSSPYAPQEVVTLKGKEPEVSPSSSQPPSIEEPKTADVLVTSPRLGIANLLNKRAAVLNDEAEDLEDDIQDDFDYSDEEIVHEASDRHRELDLPTSSDHLREPSPSDAALAKSAPPKDNNSWAPDPAQTYYFPPAGFKQEPQSQRPDYAWAGHNSVLYDAPPSMPMMPPLFPNGPPTYYEDPYFQQWPAPLPERGPSFHRPEPPSAPAATSQPPISRKRKAEDMSDDDSVVEIENPNPVVFGGDSQESVILEAQDAQANADSLPSISDLSAEPLTSLAIVESSSQPVHQDGGPAKKKQKRAKDDTRRTSRRKTFISYAATAVAGVAVGAVGVVVGLASLPADYFV